MARDWVEWALKATDSIAEKALIGTGSAIGTGYGGGVGGGTALGAAGGEAVYQGCHLLGEEIAKSLFTGETKVDTERLGELTTSFHADYVPGMEELLDEAHAKGLSRDQAYGLIDGFLDGLNGQGFFESVNAAGGDSGVLIREGRAELLDHLDEVYHDDDESSEEHSFDAEQAPQYAASQAPDTDSIPHIGDGDLETVEEGTEPEEAEGSEPFSA